MQTEGQIDLRTATREDRVPFPLAVFFPGYGHILGLVRWTDYACPQCGQVFRRDFWTHSIHIGPHVRKCKKCGILFDSGAREWPELVTSKKIRVFFPPLLVGISGGLILAGILASSIPPYKWLITIGSTMIALLPIVLWCLIRLPWILFSIRRYRANPNAGASFA